MTESQTSPKSMTDLSSDDIVAWLKANPDFLGKNPDAMDYLVPPKDNSNGRGVIDFRHYMLEKLKNDKKIVLDTTRDIIEVSRANMNNLARIHDAVLKILEATTFEEFVQTITTDLGVVLDCDVVSLIVEDRNNIVSVSGKNDIRIVPEGIIDQWMTGNDVRIQSGIRGSESVFGEAAGLVQSQALLRIDIAKMTPPAILAFGSRDPEMFHVGQGTDLIAFLCAVVERCFRLWLDLPHP